MDLALYGRVIWRFRLLVVIGVLLATLLALLSMVRISFDGTPTLQYRQSEQWVSRAMLLITEPQFPEGRSVFQQSIPPAERNQDSGVCADIRRPAAVHQPREPLRPACYERSGSADPPRGRPTSRRHRVGSGVHRQRLGVAPTSLDRRNCQDTRQARVLAQRAMNGFLRYLEREQARSGIPTRQRVVLQVVKQPNKVLLLRGRPKTLPIVIFLAVLLATFGIAFMLENLRPRLQEVPGGEVRVTEVPGRRGRRSA